MKYNIHTTLIHSDRQNVKCVKMLFQPMSGAIIPARDGADEFYCILRGFRFIKQDAL